MAVRKRASSSRAKARPSSPRARAALRGVRLAFTSHDVEGTRDFWTAILGLRAGAGGTVHAAAAVTLDFAPPEDGPPERWRPPREPLLCLEVDDVDRAHATLVERGVTFEHPPQDTADGSRLALFRDPEGRLVGLVQTLRRP